MKALLLSLLFLGVVLAGCFDAGPDYAVREDPAPGAFCHIDTCIADPDSPDAEWVREVYGLEQITHDKHREDIHVIDGDWISWSNAGNSSGNGNPVYNVYAYNLSSRELVSIDVDDEVHAFLPRIEGGRVLYSHWGPVYTGAIVWNSESDEKTYIHSEGSGKGGAIDGDWIVYSQTGAGSENGYYAYNLASEERILLYNSTMHDRNTTYKGLIGADVEDGLATYLIQYADGRDQPSSISIFVVDLETGEKREHYLPDQAASQYDQGAGFGAWGNDLSMYFLDFATGVVETASQPGEECGFPAAAESWLVYSCSFALDSSHAKYGLWLIRAENLESLQTVEIWGDAFSLNKATTDGDGILIDACRCELPDWNAPYRDLYFGRLEDLANRENSTANWI